MPQSPFKNTVIVWSVRLQGSLRADNAPPGYWVGLRLLTRLWEGGTFALCAMGFG